MSNPVADAIQELRSITRCLCEPAWTDRGKHAVECVAYCREDVDLLAATVSERDEALSSLRELVDDLGKIKPFRVADGYHETARQVDAWFKKFLKLAERTIPGRET